MKKASETTELHPLVEEIRKLFKSALQRTKVPGEASLEPSIFAAAAKKLKACSDSHDELAVDLVALRICFTRNQWTHGAAQMEQLAAMMLSADEVADNLSKQPDHHESSSPKQLHPWAQGIQPPAIGSATRYHGESRSISRVEIPTTATKK